MNKRINTLSVRKNHDTLLFTALLCLILYCNNALTEPRHISTNYVACPDKTILKLVTKSAPDGTRTVAIYKLKNNGFEFIITSKGAPNTSPFGSIAGIGFICLEQIERQRINKLQAATENRQPRADSFADNVQRQTFSTGEFPVDITSGDFNADGFQDTAVANQDSNDISILLGNADRSLNSPVNFATGEQPNSIRSGDFNNDGILDLVTANQNFSNPSLTVLRGNGDGSFMPAVAFAAGSMPGSVEVSDLNEDGNLDLIAGDFAANSVFVLMGNGDATFQTAKELAVTSGPSISIADVNNDLHTDIVATSAVLLGNGNGTFQSARDFANGLFFSFVRSADLNNDGNLDVIAGSSQFNSIAVGLGKGDGSFLPLQLYSVGKGPREVAFLVNETNTLDLVVSNFSDNRISILLNQGNGHFEAAPHFLSGRNFSSNPTGITSADFNADGYIDLAVANSSPAALLLGTADGSYEAPIDIGFTGSSVADADFNLDGKHDLALIDRNANLKILLGNANTTFTSSNEIKLSGGDSIADELLATDLNNDNISDLIIANTGTDDISVLLGMGNGDFQKATHFNTGIHPQHISINDFNKDGKTDVAVANRGDLGELNGNLSILVGNGDGTFHPAINLLPNSAVESITSADFNADGHIDLAGVIQSPLFTWNIAIMLANPNGTLQSPVNAPKPVNFFPNGGALEAKDVDADGIIDLVTVISDGAIGILTGNGDGSFRQAIEYDTGSQPHDILITDLNHDNKLDIATTAGGGVTVFTQQASDPAPKPVILANNSAQTITLDGQLSVSISMQTELSSNVDWWLAADTPIGWFYYDLSSANWIFAGQLSNLKTTFQGGLLSFPAFEVLNIAATALPAGSYTFYFGVDSKMNGIVDFDALFFNQIKVVNTSP